MKIGTLELIAGGKRVKAPPPLLRRWKTGRRGGRGGAGGSPPGRHTVILLFPTSRFGSNIWMKRRRFYVYSNSRKAWRHGASAIVLVIFGPKQLPKLSKMFGKTVSSFKQGMEEGLDEEKAGAAKDEDAEKARKEE